MNEKTAAAGPFSLAMRAVLVCEAAVQDACDACNAAWVASCAAHDAVPATTEEAAAGGPLSDADAPWVSDLLAPLHAASRDADAAWCAAVDAKQNASTARTAAIAAAQLLEDGADLDDARFALWEARELAARARCAYLAALDAAVGAAPSSAYAAAFVAVLVCEAADQDAWDAREVAWAAEWAALDAVNDAVDEAVAAAGGPLSDSDAPLLVTLLTPLFAATKDANAAKRAAWDVCDETRAAWNAAIAAAQLLEDGADLDDPAIVALWEARERAIRARYAATQAGLEAKS